MKTDINQLSEQDRGCRRNKMGADNGPPTNDAGASVQVTHVSVIVLSLSDHPLYGKRAFPYYSFRFFRTGAR